MQHSGHMTEDVFVGLRVSNTAQLTTFRRNGQGVDTPVGIQFAAGKVYFTTWTTTGKVKRLAANPQVRLAPFTKMGMKVIGPPVEGIARRLKATELEHMTTTVLKPSLWGRLWGLLYKLRGRQPVMYEVVPVSDGAAV